MMARSDDWYKDSVIYSVDVETFYDADGDGVGDFRGLTEKLDYLERLGVNCIWLLPFYPTPNRDNGYDIKDYYGVDDRLGSLGDFVEFRRAAEERGMRVLADLVVNHTSNQHRWFQRAREDPDSKYRDYYVWTDDPSEAPDRTLVFPGEEESLWTYDEVADAYYYHRFYGFQPDLNVANPAVREEIAKILGFWLELGVSGFRVDAATLMIDAKGTATEEPFEDPHQVFRDMKTFMVGRKADSVLLAEADDDPELLDEYFGGERGDEMDMLLNFVLNAHVTHALATGEARSLVEGLERLPPVPGEGRWGNFLRNFDELNLGRLSAEDQAEIYEEFAPEENMRIYGRGIRRRLGAMLDGNEDRIAMAHSLLLTLPGTPVIVSGDEIGMGDELDLPGRNPVRTPLHWNDRANAGFSTADPDDLVRPVIDDGPFDYERVNVAAQRPDPDSLLNRIERMVHTRREYRAFGRGDHTVYGTESPNTFAQGYEHEGLSVVAAHNLGPEPTTVAFDLDRSTDPESVRPILGTAGVTVDGNTCRVDLDRYGYQWLRTRE